AVIQHVLDQAAVTDGEAAARLREREHNRRDEVRWALGLVTGTAPDDRLVDEVWLLASRRQWLILVVDRAWTPAEWTDWFIAHTRAALTRSQPWRFPRS
ncbi:MAG TPA: TetR/AcrR family transcriptional regulator, partial [Gordonia sp. (in: high G+C Gram-positive bacteria)]|nr:TetR/AcrR family transcriptional regulator [Gordonia sp. (in: high G+C Gram-positive bacteria)]